MYCFQLLFCTPKSKNQQSILTYRLSALDSLLELSSIPTNELGSSLADFFPGICTHMLKTINGIMKQSHAVTKVQSILYQRKYLSVLN